MARGKPSVLESLDARARRWLLAIGLGLLACLAGSILSGVLLELAAPAFTALPKVLSLPLWAALSQLWALVVLPLVLGLAARLFELGVWPTSVIATLSGALFPLGAFFVHRGADGLGRAWPLLLVQLLGLAGGCILSALAIRRGTRAAARQMERARKAAEARKLEYEAMLASSERLAQKQSEAGKAEAEAPVSKPQEKLGS